MKSAMRSILLGLIFLSLCRLSGQAQTPPEYQDLYTAMQGSISSFNSSTLALWSGAKPPVTFAAHLSTVNSNSGPSILTGANYNSFVRQLDGFKAMGVKGVVVNIDYPILDPAFDTYGGQSSAYLTLYQNVATDIRSRGLKMIVETGAIFSDPVFSPLNVNPFYSSLSLTDYMTGRANQAALIAAQIQPDYLNVLQEPDTEAMQSGKSEVYTLSGSVNLLTTIVTAVKSTGSPIPLGAGIGTWLPNDTTGKGYGDYINAYAAIPSLDSIDVHVYPVIRDFLPRLNTIAAIAKREAKKLTVTEAWAYKERDIEFTNPAFTAAVLYSRDVFSFWAPVDAQFLQAMVNWSYYQNVEFMAAFWSDYFRAYITYDDTTKNLPPTDLFNLAHTAAGAAITSPSATTTGTAWYNAIMATADATAPTAPGISNTPYPTQILLNWTASDDTGVYKYVVTRQGGPTVTTIETSYNDTGLSDGKCYYYTVTALDFKNNKTSTTTPAPGICTPDITAPLPPTATTATAGAVVAGSPTTSSMRVTWSGATDNSGAAGINGYAIYRSVAGGPYNFLVQVPASPLSYTDSGLQQSNTQYCYKVRTQDKVLLMSTDGPIACATTKDWLPPTVPTGLTATGTAPPTINLVWNASTDGVGVAGYDVQRRLGTTGTYTIIKTGNPTTNYVDDTAVRLPDTVFPTTSVVKPAASSTVAKSIAFQASASDRGVATTYFYQVRSVDTTGNRSMWGSGSYVTWPVVGAAISSVKFFVDGIQVGVVTAAPYYIVWDSRTVANGSHTFTVQATDAAGNVTTSAPIIATVAN